MPSSVRTNESKLVTQHILTLEQWKRAKIVLLFSSLPNEIDTSELICQARKEGKTVLLPVVDGNVLRLRRYNETMHLGAYNILEPDGPDFSSYNQIDLAVIPGLAFDYCGNRLGRGKGYYDRLLTKLQAYKIGICFSFQILKSVPVEEHDLPVDSICSITNYRTISHFR